MVPERPGGPHPPRGPQRPPAPRALPPRPGPPPPGPAGPPPGAERTIGFDSVIPAYRPPPQQPMPTPEDPGDLAERTMGFDNIMAPLAPPGASPNATARFQGVLGPGGASAFLPTPLEWFELVQSGQGLAGYELSAPAGRGPLGLTFRGRRQSDGKGIVAKLINERYLAKPDLVQALVADVNGWFGHSHARLTDVLGVKQSHRRQVLLYEEAPGTPVGRLLAERGPLPPGQAMKVVFEVSQALAAAHAQGMFHGDVRSTKVYFDGEHAMLADPGLGRGACLVAGFGQHGLSFGHPDYLAPEVLQEGQSEPNALTDVYALGILFYEMLCGSRPFTGEPKAVLNQHLSAPLPPPPQGVSFNTTLAALILRMTAKDPSQRLPSASHVLDVLTLVLQGEPIAFDGPVPRRANALDASAVVTRPEAEERVSQQAWEQQSVTAARGSQRWDKAKIQNAARVGPEEWSPDAVEEDESAADKALAAVIAAATKANDASTVTKSAHKPQRGGTQKRGAALGPGQGPLKSFPTAVVGGVLVLLCVVVGLVFYPWDREPPQPKKDNAPPKLATTLVKPSDALKAKTEALDAVRKRVEEEVKAYKQRAEDLVRRGDHQEALDLAANLSEEALASDECQEAMRAVRGEVDAQQHAKLLQARQEIDAALEQEDYDRAEQVLTEVQGWLLDTSRLDALRRAVESKRDAKLRVIRKLKLAKPLTNLSGARRKLETLVNGKPLLFKGGGVQISYPRAGLELFKDLRVWKGNKKYLAMGKGGRVDKAVRVFALKQPMLIALRAPLSGVADLRLDLLIPKKLKPEARFAVFVGAQKRDLETRGVSWATTPVQLDEQGGVTDLITQPTPEIPSGVPLQFAVRLRGKPGGEQSLTAELTSRGGGPESSKPVRHSLGEPIRLGKAAGTVCIYAENVDLYITALELRGLVDPRLVN